MDELAAQLSMLSFGIIGVICVIGVIQSRPWLEMFTIGGQYVSSVTSYTLAHLAIYPMSATSSISHSMSATFRSKIR
jgi:hypothetical protein